MKLHRLPVTCLGEIFSFLDLKDLGTIALVCKRFSLLINGTKPSDLSGIIWFTFFVFPIFSLIMVAYCTHVYVHNDNNVMLPFLFCLNLSNFATIKISSTESFSCKNSPSSPFFFQFVLIIDFFLESRRYTSNITQTCFQNNFTLLIQAC